MLQPLVSIIMPVYNTEKYLERAVKSVMAQSTGNFELLLVDDGSTDASGKICDNYALKDTRIIVIHQNNQGVSVARNAGLDVVRGKYVMFIDSDDELQSNAIELLTNAALQGEYEMIIADCKVTGKDQRYSYLYAMQEKYTNVSLCTEMMIVQETKLLMSAVWAKLFHTDIINRNHLRFNIQLINGEDGDFIVEYLSHIKSVQHINEIVYILYRYDDSERVSAVSSFYYDFYDLYIMHSEKLWHIVRNRIPEGKEAEFYSRFIDGLIIYLVHMAAYQECFPNKHMIPILNSVIKNELVSTAIKVYKRSTPQFSILIPIFITLKNSTLLYFAIKLRVRRYWKTHTRSCRVKSVYRGEHIG